ncbi:sensor histidine kinase [Paraclostridium bifermentans]|uniref:sensor histidine kinase n=1 Tax=Paraclostridium bifermentans TaxID=1490 RepID=UPI00359C8FA9
MQRYCHKIIAIFYIIVFCFIPFDKANAHNYEDREQVLYISSYSPNYETFSDQLIGIKDGIKKDVDIQMEYMDSKQFFDEEDNSNFYELIKYKLKNDKRYDAVILADDQALEFGLRYRDELFKDTPIVFLGVSSEERIKAAMKTENVYGITEKHSMVENIDLIDKLHKSKNIKIITDASSQHLYEHYKDEFINEKYNDLNIENISLSNMTFNEFEQKLKSLDDNNVILVVYSYLDKTGNLKTIKQSYKLIRESTDLPIYSVMDYGLESGFIGGKVVSHYIQGQKSGEIVKNLLEGNTPKDKIIRGEELNNFVFDYDKLKDYNIKSSDLPKNSTIINRPMDTLYKYKEMIYANALLLISLLIALITLTSYTIKKLQYEKELIKAKEFAENMNKSQSNFISNISHELRTPVAVIMSSNQMLDININRVENEYTESNSEKIDIIKQNCNRLLRLINNIIDIAKVESGFMNLKLVNIDIINLLESITTSVIPYATSKNIDIVFDTSHEELIMSADPDKIERILLNLISNAIKFSKDNMSIYVNVYADELSNILTFSVKDTGIGIEDSYLEKIFEKFTQVDDVMVRKNEGSGIGLSLVKTFTNLHGGEVEVKSELGKGSEFIIKIPIKIVDEENIQNSQLDKDESKGLKAALEFSDIDF